ncbi:MAG: UDP-N-acetylglucosamine 1-carboxyvinyltransferase [Patescibacteria group bacterium]
MAKFYIKGKNELKGEIMVSGAKNAALKIIPASVLCDSTSTITNVPDILDIRKLIEIIGSIGAEINFENNSVTIDPRKIHSHHPDEKLIKKLRGSIVLVGALLSKFGKAVFSEPGGCLIGARSIDDHLDLFRQLGVRTVFKDGRYYFSGKPKAGRIILNKMSVTATENAILSTVLSSGTSQISVAAAEPEIADLANFLNKAGAKISGAGTHEITVEGVKSLHGIDYEVMPDRIEAGTYLIAGLALNSEITVGPVIPDHLEIVMKRLEDAGARFKIIEKDGKTFIKTQKHHGLSAVSLDTRPYPGFPTDLQSPYAVLMTQAKGESTIFETMFEGRFAYLEELKVLRAKVQILNPHEFTVKGPIKLIGETISSKDIRGGAALVIAALAAERHTVIEDIDFIDRGYEKIDEKLNKIGAQIERLDD